MAIPRERIALDALRAAAEGVDAMSVLDEACRAACASGGLSMVVLHAAESGWKRAAAEPPRMLRQNRSTPSCGPPVPNP